MRAVAVVLLCAGTLTGCVTLGLGSGAAAPASRDAAFAAQAADGLLVYGVTVRRTGAGAVAGDVVWLAEKADASFPLRVAIPFPAGLRAGQRGVVVWRVPAGIWSVRQMEWRGGGVEGKSSVVGSRALATTVAPGQAVYAGELVLDTGTRPAEIEVGDDLPAAQADLAGYPGVTVPPTARPLADLRVAPPGGHRHTPLIP